MLIVHVFIDVKVEFIDQFRQATLENATKSVEEAGIIRFDVVQRQDDPGKFVLVEIYRFPDAPALHKETAHYKKWKETVEPMMATPRTNIKYDPVFPELRRWEMP
jgi:quinol monooxygenase YgiN